MVNGSSSFAMNMAPLNFISISACVFSHVLAAWVTRACLSGACFLFFIVCILALCRLLFSCFCRVSFLQHSHVFRILQRVQLMFPVFASLVIHGKKPATIAETLDGVEVLCWQVPRHLLIRHQLELQHTTSWVRCCSRLCSAG